MVEKHYTEHLLICDICGEYEVHESFEEAVEAKKDGWKSRLEKGQWIDTCPRCLELG